MKSIIFHLLLFSLLLSCSKDDTEKTEVEIFIEQVKSNNYTADTLPKFSPDAIPELLKYADDFHVINNFPVCQVSSIPLYNKKVGECLLWTIEYIRLFYGMYTDYFRCPSSIPQLFSEEYVDGLDYERFVEVYHLYYHWWYDNKDIDFEELRAINPLEGSGYDWR